MMIDFDDSTVFSARARQLQPRLTERAALALFAVSRSTTPIAAEHLPLTPAVLWVVLQALHDLGLVEIANERWRATVALSDKGLTFIIQVKGKSSE